jgi:hypothetical protein
VHGRERRFRSFDRTLTVPIQTDTDGVKASPGADCSLASRALALALKHPISRKWKGY